MQRLAEGDRSAFDPLFAALWPVVLRFTERAVGPGDGPDAAQTALDKVFSNAHAFDTERDAVAWIFSIVAYECRTVKTRTRRRREEPGDVVEPASEPLEEALVRRDLERALVDALEDLSAADRELVGDVIAGKVPEMRSPTYRKRVSRAFARLRQIWSSKHDSDG